jgi:hypothetical protein
MMDIFLLVLLGSSEEEEVHAGWVAIRPTFLFSSSGHNKQIKSGVTWNHHSSSHIKEAVMLLM